MSGFFLVRRASFHAALSHLSGRGYKIMLDLLASSPRPLRFVEVPYEFQPRLHGESKLRLGVLYDYAVMIVRKRLARAFAARAELPAA
jgi:dolichol-phosphate mannosyltransferase